MNDRLPIAHDDAAFHAIRHANTLADLSASEFLRRLSRREISAEDYAIACADRIEQFDPLLHAFKSFDRERFLARARMVDAQIDASGIKGAMTGVPVAVKDVFNTYDYPTGMGSPIIEGYTPGNDARVVSNIRLAGGIVAGKTVTAEFAVHHPGETRNPYDTERTPGTSSSGSAVAVAVRMAPVALGTQTAGSIIRPASYCGVMGFKPSFGLVPRTAVLKTTDTLDTIGYFARSVEDLKLLFEVTRVHGHNYPVTEQKLNATESQPAGRPWRVGVLRGPKSSFERAAPRRDLDRVVDVLRKAGAEVNDLVLPAEFERAHDVHDRIYRKAVSYYFSIEYGAKKELFSEILRDMIESGSAIAPADYQAALQEQTRLAQRLNTIVQDVDAVIGLATADEAPVGLFAPDLPDHCLIWTLTGAPTVTMPLLRGTGGLPVGLQVMARKYNDYRLLAFAEFLWNHAAT